jgi:hypothetical protein
MPPSGIIDVVDAHSQFDSVVVVDARYIGQCRVPLRLRLPCRDYRKVAASREPGRGPRREPWKAADEPAREGEVAAMTDATTVVGHRQGVSPMYVTNTAELDPHAIEHLHTRSDSAPVAHVLVDLLGHHDLTSNKRNGSPHLVASAWFFLAT